MDTTAWRKSDFLSVKQIAEILNIHTNTAYEVIRQMPHIKIGKTYRVAVSAFEKWIRDQERKCNK